jgi:hypothetical protein
MKGFRLLCQSKGQAACLLLVALFVGCSKHKDESSTAPSTTPVASTASAPDSAAAPATDPASQAPVLDSSQMTGDPKAALADADAAIRQKEYEKAAKLMLAIQQAQMDRQQAALAHQQMVAFQRNLANAIASGDPNAKAAADILRAGRGH